MRQSKKGNEWRQKILTIKDLLRRQHGLQGFRQQHGGHLPLSILTRTKSPLRKSKKEKRKEEALLGLEEYRPLKAQVDQHHQDLPPVGADLKLVDGITGLQITRGGQG